MTKIDITKLNVLHDDNQPATANTKVARLQRMNTRAIARQFSRLRKH